jgi:hypothetical protein
MGDLTDTSGDNGTSYTLAVSGITREGEVTVAINKSGYSAYPSLRKARVYAAAASEGN